MSSLAAVAAASADDVLGMSQCCGENSTVPPILSPAVLVM